MGPRLLDGRGDGMILGGNQLLGDELVTLACPREDMIGLGDSVRSGFEDSELVGQLLRIPRAVGQVEDESD